MFSDGAERVGVDKVAVETVVGYPPQTCFKVGQFEGPLDLLWFLIKENKIDVYDIPIAKITSDFLDYIDSMEEDDSKLLNMADFYYWAAKLVLLKTRLALPNLSSADDEEEVEDPREGLVDVLIEYHKFKKLGKLLEEREERNSFLYCIKRSCRTVPWEIACAPFEKPLGLMTALLLLEEMQRLYRNVSYSRAAFILDVKEGVTVKDKLALLDEIFHHKSECSFDCLLVDKHNSLDLVTAFFAILEAAKFGKLFIIQDKSFAPIKLKARDVSVLK